MTADAAGRAAGTALVLALLWMLFPLVLLRLPFWDWPIPDWPRLVLFLFGYVAAFGLGGMLALAALGGLRDGAPAGLAPDPAAVASSRLTRLVLIVTIVMNLGALLVRASFNPFTCGNLLECSNAAYQGFVERSLAGEGAYFEYARILLSPVIYAGIAMSIWSLNFSEGRRLRGLAITVIVIEVVLALATGTARSMANLLLFALLVRLLKGRDPQARAMSTGRKFAVGIGAAVAVVIFFLYFSLLQLNRDGLVAVAGVMPFSGGYVEALSFQTGSDSFLLKGTESVVRYLCTGYFSFSLALGLSAGQTFPFGASMFLAQRAQRGGDGSFVTHSLPGQIESHYGWSYGQQWHSIFSWLMSDYPVWMVGAIMLLLGAAFVAAVYVALTQRGPMSKLPMFILFIVVLYVPANNQVLQSAEAAMAMMAGIAVLVFYLARIGVARAVPPQAAPRLAPGT